MKISARCEKIAQFLRDRRGSITTTVAIAIPVVVGMAGLGLETGLWYIDKRQAQIAADSAAVAGALERLRGGSAGVLTAATQAANKNAFTTNGSTTVSVRYPPTSGAYAGNNAAVEVEARRVHKPLFSSLYLTEDVEVAGRAVALIKSSGAACVLALDPAASAAIGNKGSAQVNMPGCVIAANSASDTAMKLTGSSIVLAHSLWLVGNYTQDGSSSVTLTEAPLVDSWPLDNPYAGETVSAPSGCKENNLKLGSGTHTLTPGTYCGGIDIGAQANVTFAHGTYVLNKGDFNVNAGAVVNCNCSAAGSGVTFELTSTGAASQIGSVTINGGATVNLTAPTDSSYPHPGILFYQDPLASSSQIAKFNGGANQSLTGAIYFPSQEVEWAGNNSPTGPTCTQIVALRITFTGNSRVDGSGCEAMGVKPITISGVRLVE